MGVPLHHRSPWKCMGLLGYFCFRGLPPRSSGCLGNPNVYHSKEGRKERGVGGRRRKEGKKKKERRKGEGKKEDTHPPRIEKRNIGQYFEETRG